MDAERWRRLKEIVEERAPDGFKILDDIMSQQGMEEVARVDERTAGFDPDTLSTRPMRSVR